VTCIRLLIDNAKRQITLTALALALRAAVFAEDLQEGSRFAAARPDNDIDLATLIRRLIATARGTAYSISAPPNPSAN
jgi:hypothetical protein